MNIKKTLVAALLLAGVAPSFAQVQLPAMRGTWQGTLKSEGISLKLIFHLKPSSDGLEASMDSPDQGAIGISFTDASIRNDSVFLELAGAHASFHGRLVNDTTLKGAWTQGMQLPLTMYKSYSPDDVQKRPQTPKAPFPYKSEEVSYFNADNSIHFAGTFTSPNQKGPAPALLLITGSGPQNRDEEIFGHKPYAVIADYLTRRGYAVLRVDDRGTGKTSGKFKGATTADFASDAAAGLDYLRTRKDVDRKKVGMLGHSEGGAIAEMLAASRKDIDFIVLLAAPGVPGAELMAEQNEAIMLRSGLTDTTVSQYVALYKKLEQIILTAKDSNDARAGFNQAINSWKAHTDRPIVALTTGISDSATQYNFVENFVESYNSKWFRYFLSYDPEPYLERVSCKVLALGGDKDAQVIAVSNLGGIKAGLAKSHATVVDVKGMPGLNHLFQDCKTCNIQEYGQLEETFSPQALEVIGDWLDKNVSAAGKQ